MNAFELWCWRRLLRVRWTARRSDQSILKEINPEYSLEGLLLKLKLQYFGQIWKADSLEKTLMLGKTEDRRRRGDRGWDGWMASPTRWTWIWANCGRWWRTEETGLLQSMRSQRVGHDWATEQQHWWLIVGLNFRTLEPSKCLNSRFVSKSQWKNSYATQRDHLLNFDFPKKLPANEENRF